MSIALPRRALLLPLVLAACGRADRPGRPIAPLRYDHLTPLRLNVATLDIEERFRPGSGDVSALAPTPPVAALRQMAQDRLQAMGNSGRAVFIIKQAALTQSRGGYDGALDATLEIFGPDGSRVGFAEARVARHHGGDGDARETLADMTRLIMDSMNVELEFQARRALRDWLMGTPDVTPAPVERQDLAPPQEGQGSALDPPRDSSLGSPVVSVR